MSWRESHYFMQKFSSFDLLGSNGNISKTTLSLIWMGCMENAFSWLIVCPNAHERICEIDINIVKSISNCRGIMCSITIYWLFCYFRMHGSGMQTIENISLSLLLLFFFFIFCVPSHARFSVRWVRRSLQSATVSHPVPKASCGPPLDWAMSGVSSHRRWGRTAGCGWGFEDPCHIRLSGKFSVCGGGRGVDSVQFSV